MEVDAIVTGLVNRLDVVVLQVRNGGLDVGGVGVQLVFRHLRPISWGRNALGAHNVARSMIPDGVILNMAVVDRCRVGSYVSCVLGMGGAGGCSRVGERGRHSKEDGDDKEESKNENHGWM